MLLLKSFRTSDS